MKSFYRCPNCGSDKVQGTAWIWLNTGKETGSEPPTDRIWCDECEDPDEDRVCDVDFEPPFTCETKDHDENAPCRKRAKKDYETRSV